MEQITEITMPSHVMTETKLRTKNALIIPARSGFGPGQQSGPKHDGGWRLPSGNRGA